MTRHMVFRCAHCRATTSVHVEWQPDKDAVVTCSTCNSTYTLKRGVNRGASDEEYLARVRRYAGDASIDVASAYSVLEGIMTREKVRTLRAASEEGVPKGSSSTLRAEGHAHGREHDGALIAGQLRAGRRQASPEPVAQATARAPRVHAPQTPATRPAVDRGSWIVGQLDDRSHLTRLSGPDPRSVLEALCEHEAYAGNLVPHALAPGDLPGFESRIGIAHDRLDPAQMVSVKIWLDPRKGRWNVGDGRAPLQLEPLTDLPGGAETF